MAPGIYVIEVQRGVIKVGMSKDTDARIATHLRNARGLGQDPYRYTAIEVPAELLRSVERRCHAAMLASGAEAAPRSPEVFSGTNFSLATAIVKSECEDCVEYEEAMGRLGLLGSAALEESLGSAARDVRLVVRRLVLG